MSESETKRLHAMIKGCLRDFTKAMEETDLQDKRNGQYTALEKLEKNYQRLLDELAMGNEKLIY